MRKTGAVILFFYLAVAAWAQEANPGRPTVSTPATLTPVGYLQFETGVLGAEHSPDLRNQVSFNEVMKFSVSSRLELLLQTQPFAHSDLGAFRSNDAGDVSTGLQAVLLPGTKKRPTISVSYFRRVFGGTAPDLDIGSNRQSALLLLSTDIAGFHVDTNALFNEQIENARHRAQFGQTLSISHELPRHFGVSGELWHFTQPFQNGHATGFLFAHLHGAAESGVRCRLQSRSYLNQHTVGGVYGIHVPFAEEASLTSRRSRRSKIAKIAP